MKQLILIGTVTLFAFTSHAQQYKTALGFKSNIRTMDVPAAELTVKQFFTERSALELNFGGSRRYLWLQNMYMRRYEIHDLFDMYWGAGLDAGYWEKGNHGIRGTESTSGYWVGLSGCIGLEYTTKVVPINLAVDMGPSWRVVPQVEFGWMASFSIRYAVKY